MSKISFLRPQDRTPYVKQMLKESEEFRVKHAELMKEVDELTELYGEITRLDHETCLDMGWNYFDSKERVKARQLTEANLAKRKWLIEEAQTLGQIQRDKWAWLYEAL